MGGADKEAFALFKPVPTLRRADEIISEAFGLVIVTGEALLSGSEDEMGTLDGVALVCRVKTNPSDPVGLFLLESSSGRARRAASVVGLRRSDVRDGASGCRSIKSHCWGNCTNDFKQIYSSASRQPNVPRPMSSKRWH